MPIDPVDQAAQTYDRWNRLEWGVEGIGATLKEVRQEVRDVRLEIAHVDDKVDKLTEAKVNALESKVVLIEERVSNLTKHVESRQKDNWEWLKYLAIIASLALAAYGAFKPH